jgi:cysteinyl-tRNA synthetase
MAREHLGDGFDVHGGGLDLVFPHHENERAQSEGAGAHPFTRCWLHNGMLRLGDEKMSKSVGNVERLRDALDRVGRETLLVFFAGASYRMPIDYHERTLGQAAAVAERFRETLRNARRYVRADAAGADAGIATVGGDAATAFDAALADDLDTPAALAVLHGLATELNAAVGAGDAEPGAVAAAADAMRDALWVLGLHTLDPGSDAAELPPDVVALAQERDRARAERDFARSDELRDAIAAHGYLVRDTPQGFELVPHDAAT